MVEIPSNRIVIKACLSGDWGEHKEGIRVES